MVFENHVLRKINKESIKNGNFNAWIILLQYATSRLNRSHSFDEVLSLFRKNKINFINSYPSCEPFQTNKEEELEKTIY